MPRVIALANQKGGVGKSTSAQNLGMALGELGSRVLLVDLDPQAALTLMCGVSPDGATPTLGDALAGRARAADLLQRPRPQVWLLPGSASVADFETAAHGLPDGHRRLQAVIDGVGGGFDIVLVDAPPTLGLLTLNALVAASEVIVPLQLEFLALNGMKALFQTIARVRDQHNRGLRVTGILATMHRGRALHSDEVLERVRDRFGDLVFEAVVRNSVRFPESSAGGLSILEYDGRSPGAFAYRQLAEEVMRRG